MKYIHNPKTLRKKTFAKGVAIRYLVFSPRVWSREAATALLELK